MNELILVSHRGFRKGVIENTPQAFNKSVELGMDFIELDVHLTSDKELVVVHDETFERIFSVKKKVKKMKWSEISTIRSVDGNQGVPLLERVFDEFSGRIKFMIELKGEGTAVPVVKMLKQKGISNSVISSRDLGMLKVAREKANEMDVEIQICLNITSCKAFPVKKLIVVSTRDELPLEIDMVSLRSTLVDTDYITKCHDLDIKALCWDFVSPEKPLELARKLVSMGIDGFLLDDPEMVKEFIKK